MLSDVNIFWRTCHLPFSYHESKTIIFWFVNLVQEKEIVAFEQLLQEHSLFSLFAPNLY